MFVPPLARHSFLRQPHAIAPYRVPMHDALMAPPLTVSPCMMLSRILRVLSAGLSASKIGAWPRISSRVAKA